MASSNSKSKTSLGGSRPVSACPEPSRLGALNDPKLLRVHLRYHPPALTLEYLDAYGKKREKIIELFDFDYGTNIQKLCAEIINSEPLFCNLKQKRKLMDSLKTLKNQTYHDFDKKYVNFRTIKPHSLPLTDACISKDGMRCATSCLGNAGKLWCTQTGEELSTLMGHKHAISSISMNPAGDQVLTSSHDGTLRLWHYDGKESATCQQLTASERKARVLFSKFSPDYQMAISATDDCNACVHDLVNGVLMYKFSSGSNDHREITSVNLDKTGSLLLSSPYDKNTAGLWDLRSGEMADTLQGHHMEITKSMFDFNSQTIATSSLDSTVKIWDLRNLDESIFTFYCESEVLDCEFDLKSRSIAAGTSEGQVLCWDVGSGNCNWDNKTYKAPVSKVLWNPNGKILAAASEDGTVPSFSDPNPNHRSHTAITASNHTSHFTSIKILNNNIDSSSSCIYHESMNWSGSGGG